MERNRTRLDQLFEFYREDPNDAFTIYAIATEYVKINPEKALEYYQILLKDHPDYVATYYHAGKLYEGLGQKEEAEKIYQQGLVVSRQQGNRHAFSELQQAYNNLMGLDYDDDE
ncbi:tetratricopeptide repeat protein [Adhaeribacter swui]|uniref:Tetratricopeptide repeat protein n=1 Tax=Adhaeribacter swui TaxID=2086471 RepID=A0A7G7GAH8_9BACT|nr:tetratricopeptide repeat protein [Adhaeribacter swui]QNF34162.1 tetratricopeptide repeat protein [Adhaeribacter swui]